MISLIAGLGIFSKMNPKNARAIAWMIVIVGAVLLAWGAKAIYDANVVHDYRTEVNLDAAVKDRKADQKAGDRATANAQRAAFERDQLEKAVSNAPRDPKIDDDIERRLAFHRCLRLQQSARANSGKPPRCV